MSLAGTPIASNPSATTVSFTASQQIGDGNSQGSINGPATSSIEGFFGQTGSSQPNVGPANILVGNGTNDTALVTKYQLTQATTAVAASSSAEITTTVCTGLLTTDVVAVNKPTATAGIGVVGYRVTAANKVGISYSNISSGSITTSAETYDVLGFSSSLTTTAALSPASVPSSTGNEQTFTVTGATLGSFPIVNKPTLQAALGISNVRVPAEGQVAITFLNNSSGAITPTAAESYSFAFVPTLAPASPSLIYNVQLATSAVAASSSSEQTSTITGLGTTDVISGVSKPSAQTGLGVVGYRVSAANAIGVTYMEVSSAVTTTAETYAITVNRLVAKAPAVVLSAALTPASVAATSSAEQTFTVNGLPNASTSVLVSKPSFTPGLHVVNARVSGASTLAITYQNNNTTAVVPPAETYGLLWVPLQGPGAIATTGTSQSIQVPVLPMSSAVKDLRTALINLGLMSSV